LCYNYFNSNCTIEVLSIEACLSMSSLKGACISKA
jgi:hypothetical protein